jgi:hypothetical protein
MSEHEGFGVPLVESMLMDVPILAYGTTAVPHTLGGAGVQFDKKDVAEVAEMAYDLAHDQPLRDAVLAGQRQRLEAFAPKTVAIGWYDAAGEPVLRVGSGDELIVRALSTCSPASLVRAGLDTARVEQLANDIYAARSSMKTGPGGHILTGPIYVEGADSGDVLEVRFKSIKPAINYACNSFGPRSGFLREDFPNTSRSKIIELDTVRMLGHFSSTITIPLHPFFGSVGVAPPASMGRVNSAPPGIHAGNLDNKELVAGTTLYIGLDQGRCSRSATVADRTARWTSPRWRRPHLANAAVVRKDMHIS